MFCLECKKIWKTNSFTVGCQTFKTSSMVRHEAITDHQSAIQSPQLQKHMEVVMKNTQLEEDQAIIKSLKVVYWMATENIPLSKYSSLINLLKMLHVPGLGCLAIGSRIDYKSYYSANELLEAPSDTNFTEKVAPDEEENHQNWGLKIQKPN